MINRLVQYLLKRINVITKYLFWIYFLLIIAYYYLLDDSIPAILTYLFWLFLGLRGGTILTLKSKSNL